MIRESRTTTVVVRRLFKIRLPIRGAEAPVWREATRARTGSYATKERQGQPGWISVPDGRFILTSLLTLVLGSLLLPVMVHAQERLSTGRINEIVVEAALHRPILGPTNAPITILYWTSLSSPHSALVRGRIRTLRQRFPDSIRIVALPMLTNSLWERSLQRIAWTIFQRSGNQRFWEFLDAIWMTPRRKLILATVKKLALATGGLSPSAVDEAFKKSEPILGSLDASILLYMLTGTSPRNGRHWFLVADKVMQLTYSTKISALESLIVAQLPKARTKIRQGMSADDVAQWHVRRALSVTNLHRTWKDLTLLSPQTSVLMGHAPVSRRTIATSGLPIGGPAHPTVMITVFLSPTNWRTVASLRSAQALQKRHPRRIAINVYLMPAAGRTNSVITIKQLLAAHLQGQFWTALGAVLRRGRLIPRRARPGTSKLPTSIDWKRLARDAKGPTVRHLLQHHLRMAHRLGVLAPGAMFVNGVRVPVEATTTTVGRVMLLTVLCKHELRRGWLSRLSSKGTP